MNHINFSSIKENLLKEKELKLKLYERLKAEKEMMIRKTVNLQSSAMQIMKDRNRKSPIKCIPIISESMIPKRLSDEQLIKVDSNPISKLSEILDEKISESKSNCDNGFESVNISSVEFDPRETRFLITNPFNPDFNEEEKSRIYDDTEKKLMKIDTSESKFAHEYIL